MDYWVNEDIIEEVERVSSSNHRMLRASATLTKSLIVLVAILAFFMESAAQAQVAIPKRGTAMMDSIRTLSVTGTELAPSKSDSIQAVVNGIRFKDSLRIEVWSTNLQSRVQTQLSAVRVTGTIDSLASAGVPANRLNEIADSLLLKRHTMLKEIETKKARLNSLLSGRYLNWNKSYLNPLKMDSFGITGPLPPSLQSMDPSVAMPASSIAMPGLTASDFSSLEMSDDLKAVGGDFAVPSTEQFQSMELNLPQMPKEMPNSINEIATGTAELKAVKQDPGTTAETAVSRVSEVNSATQELQKAEQLSKSNEALQAKDQLRAVDLTQPSLQGVVSNHLEGREAELQKNIEKMTRFKQQYPTLTSLSEIKKSWLPRNALKGVPFRDRIRIGMNLGFRSTKDTLLLDLLPNASYRISGRFEAGLGLLYRLRMQTKDFSFDQKEPVWGVNTFVVARTFKGIHLRVELDGNSFPKQTSERSYRDWRWSLLSGVQTRFSLGQRWSGNVQILYNFDNSLKDGFPEKVTARMGVQYRFARKR